MDRGPTSKGNWCSHTINWNRTEGCKGFLLGDGVAQTDAGPYRGAADVAGYSPA